MSSFFFSDDVNLDGVRLRQIERLFSFPPSADRLVQRCVPFDNEAQRNAASAAPDDRRRLCPAAAAVVPEGEIQDGDIDSLTRKCFDDPRHLRRPAVGRLSDVTGQVTLLGDQMDLTVASGAELRVADSN